MNRSASYLKALEEERAYYATLCRLEHQAELQHIMRNVDIRTAKSQGVLTHTSIMIGLLGAIIAFVDPQTVPAWLTLALFVELLAYIGLTAYLILTMKVSAAGALRNDVTDDFIMLARKRRKMHNLVVNAVAALTVVFALTLIVEFAVLVRAG